MELPKYVFIRLRDVEKILTKTRGPHQLRGVDTSSVRDIMDNMSIIDFDEIHFGIPAINIPLTQDGITFDTTSWFSAFRPQDGIKIWNKLFSHLASHICAPFTKEMLAHSEISDGQHRLSALCEKFRNLFPQFFESVAVVQITRFDDPKDVKRFSAKNSTQRPHVRQSVYDMLSVLTPLMDQRVDRRSIKAEIEALDSFKSLRSSLSDSKQKQLLLLLTDFHISLFDNVRALMDAKRSLLIFSPQTITMHKNRRFSQFFKETSRLVAVFTHNTSSLFSGSDRNGRHDCQLFVMILIASAAEVCQSFDRYEPSDVLAGVLMVLSNFISNASTLKSNVECDLHKLLFLHGIYGTLKFISSISPHAFDETTENPLYDTLCQNIKDMWSTFYKSSTDTLFSERIRSLPAQFQDFVKMKHSYDDRWNETAEKEVVTDESTDSSQKRTVAKGESPILDDPEKLDNNPVECVKRGAKDGDITENEEHEECHDGDNSTNNAKQVTRDEGSPPDVVIAKKETPEPSEPRNHVKQVTRDEGPLHDVDCDSGETPNRRNRRITSSKSLEMKVPQPMLMFM